MSEFFGSIWWLIVTLGLLVTFHEFGHFWVARRFGVKVLRFSVGFGKPLVTRVGRDGTEFVVAAIPLGGYVKMLDEREGDVDAIDLPRAFNRKPVLARIAIVAAGPVFNLLFAVIAFWAMFVVGRADFQPTIGKTTAIAAEAGLRRGDHILSIDGETTPSWSQAYIALVEGTIARRDVDVTVRRADGDKAALRLPLSHIPRELDEAKALRAIGIRPLSRVPAIAGDLPADRPLIKAGVRTGDRIVAVNAIPVATFDDLYDTIQAEAAKDPSLLLTVRRGEDQLQLRVGALPGIDGDGQPNLQVGFAPAETAITRDALERYGPLDAVPAAFRETWRMTALTFKLMRHLIVGNASLKNVSGPIGIAQSANFSARQGVDTFLWFLAVMSLSIGILNLLPIPILDGGHLLYYLIELVKGSPVTERTVAFGQYLGLALLIGLMGLAFYNDIVRLIS